MLGEERKYRQSQFILFVVSHLSFLRGLHLFPLSCYQLFFPALSVVFFEAGASALLSRFFCALVCVSHSGLSNSLQPQGLQPARLLCPWDFPGQNTRVGCHFVPSLPIICTCIPESHQGFRDFLEVFKHPRHFQLIISKLSSLFPSLLQ